MKQICVIFDLDGTLVDSESLCNEAFIDLVPDLSIPLHELTEKNRGRELITILSEIEADIGRELGEDFEVKYRARVSEIFDTKLKAFPGVKEMISALSCPYCIASSGPLAKIEKALRVCDLFNLFEGRIFSSYHIGSWKPAPDLFLHAASAMGFQPSECVVVEDSDAGVAAGLAAGMKVYRHRPDREVARLPDVIDFQTMDELTRLLAKRT